MDNITVSVLSIPWYSNFNRPSQKTDDYMLEMLIHVCTKLCPTVLVRFTCKFTTIS